MLRGASPEMRSCVPRVSATGAPARHDAARRAPPSAPASAPRRRCVAARAVKDRNPLELATTAAAAAVEVSRAVRERGVLAPDAQKSFVALGVDTGVVRHAPRRLTSAKSAFLAPFAVFCGDNARPRGHDARCARQADEDGLPLVYDRSAIQAFWDSKPGELQARAPGTQRAPRGSHALARLPALATAELGATRAQPPAPRDRPRRHHAAMMSARGGGLALV